MERKSSRVALLRLPLAQNNKRKISDIDENASDGYDQPGHLVIDTNKNYSVSFTASDRAEHSMKDGRNDFRNQQQLCQIDIVNSCYVVGNTFKGQVLIHVRIYDRRDDGTLFRTKKVIALNLEKWKKFQYCYLENIDSAVDQYQESKPVDLFIHMGGNYHVSVKN